MTEKSKQNLTGQDILKMSREELVDFLLEYWDQAKQLPDKSAKEYLMTRTDLCTMENMQGVAFELIIQ